MTSIASPDNTPSPAPKSSGPGSAPPPSARWPFSTVVAGFITVLVGVVSSGAIVLQAANAAGADARTFGSWMGVLGLAMGLSSCVLSWRYRAPVVTAWSTPGAALLAISLPGHSMGEAIGAFMFSSFLITLCGMTGWFERIMNRIPLPLASAMLAGILVHFGISVFSVLPSQPLLVGAMLLVYLLCKRAVPRYAILATLLVGTAIAWQQHTLRLDLPGLTFGVAHPVFVMPQWHWATIVGIGLPLFIVTMASQNVPGVSALRAAGYRDVPVSPAITWTGILGLVLAPFGCFAVNLAAISAAICQSAEAHPNPAQRYKASFAAGVFYLVVGLFGATVATIFAVFPPALIAALAGIALFSTIGSALAGAMQSDGAREPALLTFLVTASGVTIGGIGSALWGVVAGGLAWWILVKRPRTA